ncbi:hypothetical protein CS542_07685 [Pedobacter sp. IW39]|nr:hypothetical protein CS542_07685 [Pedobacter sp. IW39]
MDNPYDENGSPIYVDGNSTFKWWSRDKVNPIFQSKTLIILLRFDVNYDFAVNYHINDWLTFSSTNRGSAAFNKVIIYSR